MAIGRRTFVGQRFEIFDPTSSPYREAELSRRESVAVGHGWIGSRIDRLEQSARGCS